MFKWVKLFYYDEIVLDSLGGMMESKERVWELSMIGYVEDKVGDE